MPPKDTKETKESSSPKPTKKAAIKKKIAKPAAPSKRFTLDGPRKRKVTERYTETTTASKEKEIVVKKGKGKKLSDCENVATQINKRKRSDDTLHALYSIIYGRVTKKSPLKDHLLSFSGMVYEDDDAKKGREKLEAKLEKLNVNVLKDVLMFFGQDPAGKKEEIVDHLASFLEKPAPSDQVYESKKRKRSSSSSRSKSRSKSPAKKKRKAKKDPNAPKRALSAYMLFCKHHRPAVVKKNPKEPVTEIAKLLAKMWNKAGNDEKKPFEKDAEKAKAKYEQEMKKYKAGKGGSKKASSKTKKEGSKSSSESESGSDK